MSIFAEARKCDLKILAEKLGGKVDGSHKLKDLKTIILASKEYDEEYAKEWLNTIINERKERDEASERKRQEEIAEQKHQEEIQMEERRRREEQEYEELKRREEYEERKRKDEMEFELQKVRLRTEGRFSNSVANQNVNSTQMKPKLETHHLMQKWNSDENNIRLYLIMFERLAKQAEILENTWIKCKVSQEVKDHFIDDWRSWNEDDDVSSENSDDEPEMQRPKRTVHKPVRC
ncbi:hypothetical protein AVEN_228233-1 [Araneus ventricosus]|uniref:Uncharacterized protein n=1 Tax=Araneus ventricosus TaxID=182803 RepID=A0A4Y2GC22_ARAVE|nr:hypothetical protein AVEN_228233-1 [Araneus ventricosus]